LLKRLLLLVAIALPLALPGAAPGARAQGDPPSFEIPYIRIPGSNASKFPNADGFRDRVSVAGNANRSDALYWEKSSTSRSFSGPIQLGDARDNPDYFSAAVDYAPDGTLFYVWSDRPSRRINLRVRAPGGDFSGERAVLQGSGWPGEPEVAVTSIGGVRTVFVFWREANGDLRFRLSQDDGRSWPIGGVIASGTFPGFTTYSDSNGAVAVGFNGPSGDELQAYGAFWTGSSFRIERISPRGNGEFANPSISREPNGTFVAVFRGIGEGGNYGTYVSARNPDGSWNNSTPFGRLDRGNINSVWVDVDPQGTWHVFWAGDPAARSGSNPPENVYYAERPAGQTGFTRAAASGAGGGVYNVDGALTFGRSVYAHAVYEKFDGDIARYGYSMVNVEGLVPPSAQAIVIAQGNDFTNQRAVRVDFVGVANSPTQVRYNWGDSPIEGDPIVPFSNPISIPLPELNADEPCSYQVLYTQLIGAGGTQEAANVDAVIVDRAVGATASIFAAQPGIDLSFARSTAATVRVTAESECSGLDSAIVSGGAANVSIPIGGRPQGSGNVTLTGGDGEKRLTVAVRDGIGNIRNLSVALTLDTTNPVLTNPGDVTVEPGDEYSGVASVSLSGLGLSELNPYGAYIVTRYTPEGGTTVTGTPQVVPLELAGGRARFSYSVASGLPRGAAGAGRYDLIIRFVDKAGNLSSGSTRGAITFEDAPAFPRLFLPLVGR